MFEALDPSREKELLEYQEQVRQDTALDLTVERPANLTDSRSSIERLIGDRSGRLPGRQPMHGHAWQEP